MSRLREEIERLRNARNEKLSSRWENINATIDKWKAQVETINNELKETTYKPRRVELVKQREEILEQAKNFFYGEKSEQAKIYDSFKAQFDALVPLEDGDLKGVNLTSIDNATYNTSFLKDVINVSNREEIEDMFEDACHDGKAELAKIIQVYSKLKFNESASDNADTSSFAANRANREAASLDRVKRLLQVESAQPEGISVKKYGSINTALELANSIYDPNDPWKAQYLNV